MTNSRMNRQPNVSLGLQVLLLANMSLSNLTDAHYPKTSVVIQMSDDCRDQYIRLDKEDYGVKLTNNDESDYEAPVKAGVTCKAHFMTDLPDTGICITNNDIYFRRPGVTIQFITSQLGSEKVLRKDYHQFDKWCTDQSIVTVSVSADRYLQDQNDNYRFSFIVSNVSTANITRQYIMDSFKHCDTAISLAAGEEIVIMPQRYPSTSDLPLSCQLSLATTSEDEYEELCVTITDYIKTHDCRSTLEIRGFISRFWPEKRFLGCNDSTSTFDQEEMCSSNKRLVLDLTRNNINDTGFSMRTVVKSKWHTKWGLLSQEAAELRGLSFMKGLTYFIATIDCLAGILGAVLASMFRHPKWFWKDWVVTKSTSCEAVHYEASYPEAPNAEIEKINEASAY